MSVLDVYYSQDAIHVVQGGGLTITYFSMKHYAVTPAGPHGYTSMWSHSMEHKNYRLPRGALRSPQDLLYVVGLSGVSEPAMNSFRHFNEKEVKS